MTSELLQREEEFHKLNAELEMRTKALMHEVDSVMKIQSSMVNDSKQRCTSASNVTSECSDVWENYESNSAKHPAITQCLKTKITVLHRDLEDVKGQYKRKCSEFKQLQAEYCKLEDEKNKWQHLSLTHQDQKEKTSSQISTLSSKLQIKEAEVSALRKENDTLKNELKTTNTNCANYELRINKLIEELERCRASLKTSKRIEKELRDAHRKELNELAAANKCLKKHIVELSTGFRKQMLLIDNLKKQKMYLESTKLLQIREDEFSKILDWKPSE
ncbi:uncharacterized protein CBL_20604 [Carabus blaptoides fortunei]